MGARGRSVEQISEVSCSSRQGGIVHWRGSCPSGRVYTSARAPVSWVQGGYKCPHVSLLPVESCSGIPAREIRALKTLEQQDKTTYSSSSAHHPRLYNALLGWSGRARDGSTGQKWLARQCVAVVSGTSEASRLVEILPPSYRYQTTSNQVPDPGHPYPWYFDRGIHAEQRP